MILATPLGMDELARVINRHHVSSVTEAEVAVRIDHSTLKRL
jgi:hypothetical protein